MPQPDELLRCLEEQRQAAALLIAGHPDRRGLAQCLDDWMAEEILLREEADSA